jgi:serine/threonine-protein kinase RsbW
MTASYKPTTQTMRQDSPVFRAWSRTFPATADQVHHARRGLAGFLQDSPLADDAIMCLSELVTNSIEHSNSRAPGGRVTIRATVTDEVLRVEVEDQGGPWRQLSTGWDSPGGRGLGIVAALSHAWGKTDGDAGSRAVWFEMSAGTGVPSC